MTDIDGVAPLPGQAPPRGTAWMRYWGVLLFAGSLWGVTFSLARIATEDGAHPVGLNLLQAVIGFVVLGAYLLMRGRRLPLSPRHLVFYCVCGFVGTALPGAMYFFAAIHVPAGVLAITIATVPMLTVLLAVIFQIERPGASRLLGLMLGIIGVGLIVLPESSLPDPAIVPWVLLAVACACCYAVENLYIALRMPENVDAATVLCGMMAMGSIMTFLVAWWLDAVFVPQLPPSAVEWSVIGMAVINAASYAMFVYLVNSAGPVFASQMAYVVTLSGVAWGMVLFNEQHSGWIWTSLVILMIGMALVKPREDAARV